MEDDNGEQSARSENGDAAPDGVMVPYWVAKSFAVAAGFPIKTVNLSSVAPEELHARCCDLEEEMRDFLARIPRGRFDGTLGSLLRLYQGDSESPYRVLKPTSAEVYTPYLRRLIAAYGDAQLARLTGLDVKRWHKAWLGDDNRIGAASMAFKVLKAAISFGVVSGFPHCDRLRGALFSALRLPGPKPRTFAPTADDVEKVIVAAHAMRRHSAAFASALQFETAARQADVVGQWVSMSDPRPSAVTFRGRKWVGPTWSAIDANLVLTLTPSKTERSTGARVHVDLSRCPMVMAELAMIPQEARSGPLVVNERTGLP
jgi:hypothetical protein